MVVTAGVVVTKLGVTFGGIKPASTVINFEHHLGRPVGIIGVFTEENAMPSTPIPGHRMLWSPKWRLFDTPTPDSVILAYCRYLVATGQADSIIRPMWEPNGAWMGHWYGLRDVVAWVARYRHIAHVIRSVTGQRFLLEWNINITEEDPAEVVALCPGLDVFDIFGMDVYSHYPTGHWEQTATGLAWLRKFAAAHNRPYAFSEWAVTNTDDTAYTSLMARYINDPACSYAIWNEYLDGSMEHRLMSGKFPRATAIVKMLP